MGLIGYRGSARPKWEIDTFEKALTVIEGLKMLRTSKGFGYGSTASNCLRFILNKYPEFGLCTHEHIAEQLGMTRESVTRGMNYRRVK